MTFDIARLGDHLALGVQDIIFSVAVHRGNRPPASAAQIDPVKVDLTCEDIDAARKDSVALRRPANGRAAVKGRQNIGSSAEHLDDVLGLQLQHHAKEEFRARHAQKRQAVRLRGGDQNPLFADPAQVADLGLPDRGGEDAFAGGYPADRQGALLANHHDPGDQVAAGRKLHMVDSGRGAIGVKRGRLSRDTLYSHRHGQSQRQDDPPCPQASHCAPPVGVIKPRLT